VIGIKDVIDFYGRDVDELKADLNRGDPCARGRLP